MSRALPFLASLSLLAAAGTGAAQSPSISAPAQVLILGTHHLAGSTDFTATEPDDILSEHRQREVEELVHRLAAFRPTKIAVEVPADRDSLLRARYQAYRAGSHALGRSETEQIGFRLARLLGHDKLYAIDFRLNEDIGRVVQWAAEHGDTGFVSLVGQFAARMKAAGDSIRTLPLLEALRRQNTPEYDALHSGYMRMARVGSEDGYVGAEVVAGRYERNLKIFANLSRSIEPGDRVLVIYGASHGKLLRDFVRESQDMELIPVERFLDGSDRGAR